MLPPKVINFPFLDLLVYESINISIALQALLKLEL